MVPVNVLVIGAGMYVCGRGTTHYGTIMPALCEWARSRAIGEVIVAGLSAEGIQAAARKIAELQHAMGLQLAVRYFPTDRASDPQCYQAAIRRVAKPACAIVAVPDHLHREMAGAAMTAGLHVLVVKPLTPTLQEAHELLELQQRYRVYGAVEFHKRFDRANLQLREAMTNGTIGEPLYALVEYSQRKSVPAERFKPWLTHTDIFQYLGVHYVDILYFVTRALPRRVMAMGQKGWLQAREGLDVHDAIEAVIEWELPSGRAFTSHILTNWIDPESTSAMSDQQIKIIGTRGRFESDQKRRGLTIVTDEAGIEEPNPDFCASYRQNGHLRYHGYGIESVQQFLDDVCAIEDGRLTPEQLEGQRPTLQEALVSTAVVEAARESVRRDGAWVRVPEMAWQR